MAPHPLHPHRDRGTLLPEYSPPAAPPHTRPTPPHPPASAAQTATLPPSCPSQPGTTRSWRPCWPPSTCCHTPRASTTNCLSSRWVLGGGGGAHAGRQGAGWEEGGRDGWWESGQCEGPAQPVSPHSPGQPPDMGTTLGKTGSSLSPPCAAAQARAGLPGGGRLSPVLPPPAHPHPPHPALAQLLKPGCREVTASPLAYSLAYPPPPVHIHSC